MMTARRAMVAIGLAMLAAPPSPAAATSAAAGAPAPQPRERINIDADWRFALGHATDPARDFGYGTAPFFFAKAGYGDGPASPVFDDRAWRRLDVPHDWAVELPFSAKADGNHGSRSIGPGFPEHDIGWYRKRLQIPASDRGRRIAIELDGVFRDAVVWFNGHYLGEEHSGYSGTRYDLTDYVDYGGANTLVVRVDASRFEGWFYEGAGIYRHVWLTKTDPVHVAFWGTAVATRLNGTAATVTARATIRNEDRVAHVVTVDEAVVDAAGRTLAVAHGRPQSLAPGAADEVAADLALARPRLWSLDDPALHRLVTTVSADGIVRDRTETSFGVREVRWDAATGFWLNGRSVKLQGANNHQDHAGIGVALPDAMQTYRLERLKAMGANACRTAHGPPTPELLDAADRLGMLVIDEHRMMGTAPELTDQLTRLIRRDRNHPSVILWSVGNEEWGIEGKELGARLTERMQATVRALDPTRPSTAVTAGNDGKGISTTTAVAGFNYRAQHDVDAYHRAFPTTPVVMTEEGSTFATRGVYVDDPAHQHLAAYDRPQRPTGASSVEQGWRAVAERPWLAGMFVWTGFDYRGETTPFEWPAIGSQFGMLDTTGLFKDSAWYLQSQWTARPMAHIVGHWTWPGRERQAVPIWIDTNGDAAELLLNGRSLGRKPTPPYGHLEWQVPYAPGVLTARAYRRGRMVATDRVETAGPAYALALTSVAPGLAGADRRLAVVTVRAVDRHGRIVPRADDQATFALSGPAHILGVGNGDPSSHEPDKFVDRITIDSVAGWQLADLPGGMPAASGAGWSALAWRDPFRWYPPGAGPATPDAFVLRGHWQSIGADHAALRRLYVPLLAPGQRLFVGGRDLTAAAAPDGSGWSVMLDAAIPRDGVQEIALVIPQGGPAALARLQAIGANGSNVAFVQQRDPAPPWSRALFNGYAQVIVERDAGGGVPARLTATAPGLRPAAILLDR